MMYEVPFADIDTDDELDQLMFEKHGPSRCPPSSSTNERLSIVPALDINPFTRPDTPIFDPTFPAVSGIKRKPQVPASLSFASNHFPHRITPRRYYNRRTAKTRDSPSPPPPEIGNPFKSLTEGVENPFKISTENPFLKFNIFPESPFKTSTENPFKVSTNNSSHSSLARDSGSTKSRIPRSSCNPALLPSIWRRSLSQTEPLDISHPTADYGISYQLKRTAQKRCYTFSTSALANSDFGKDANNSSQRPSQKITQPSPLRAVAVPTPDDPSAVDIKATEASEDSDNDLPSSPSSHTVFGTPLSSRSPSSATATLPENNAPEGPSGIPDRCSISDLSKVVEGLMESTVSLKRLFEGMPDVGKKDFLKDKLTEAHYQFELDILKQEKFHLEQKNSGLCQEIEQLKEKLNAAETQKYDECSKLIDTERLLRDTLIFSRHVAKMCPEIAERILDNNGLTKATEEKGVCRGADDFSEIKARIDSANIEHAYNFSKLVRSHRNFEP